MKAKMIICLAAAFLAVGCATANNNPNYNVTVKLSPEEDDLMVYMVDLETGQKLDSAVVANGTATFSGNVAEPVYVRLLAEGSRLGNFFLEPAQITVEPEKRSVVSDGELQGKMNQLSKQSSELVNEYYALADNDSSATRRQQIETRLQQLEDSTRKANIDNALGRVMFYDYAMGLSLEQLDKELAAHPRFAKIPRIQTLRESLLKKAETSVGKKYKDFEVTYNGKTQRLSDYVGNGHYTLVDFWASWCGPCIRETKVIKKLYDKYNGKGLEFLGVAVWDEPDKTLKAIEDHQLPWPMIINAQKIPTDLYGIQGIPCIILIAPDGTIVSRDQQEQALIDDVDAAMAKYNEAQKEAE